MSPLSAKRLKISILILSLVAILTWGLLAALVITNQLPGYISPKAMGSLDIPGVVNGWIWF